jgi:(p)ppGpp synthase/HD superfamily hydrolase
MDYLIDKAIKFATQAHSGQYRKGSDLPYITHPFAVSIILAQEGASQEQIIAGILHDVVEDTDVTIEEIKENFGNKVADLVFACSEYDPKASWYERKVQTINHLTSATDEVKLIVCADKLHNLMSIKEDLQTNGEAVWKRFGKGRDSQEWYYKQLVEILCKDLKFKPSESIYHRFKTTFNEVFYKK